jgi:hypothetical protein
MLKYLHIFLPFVQESILRINGRRQQIASKYHLFFGVNLMSHPSAAGRARRCPLLGPLDFPQPFHYK